MGINNKLTLTGVVENFLRISILFAMSLIIVLMGVAVFDKNNSDEAYMGDFSSGAYNDSWYFDDRIDNDEFSLPVVVHAKKGDEVTIVNTLPEDVTDGMSLMTKASMQDIYIYIDGELRNEYSSESISNMTEYVPTAYVVTDLTKEDAGKEIKIHYIFKGKRIINQITLNHGNNGWYDVIKSAISVNFIALFVLVLGVVLFVAAVFVEGTVKVGATRYLGLLIINLSLWILSESTLRQFIFNRPLLSHFYSYFLVEILGAIACLYFDEVQHRHYHKRYLCLECLVMAQLVINVSLHIFGIRDLYESMKFSHFWTFLCAVNAVVNIVNDIREKRVKEYIFTVCGMICFIIMSMSELIGFYLNGFHVFGTEICIALILLTTATIIQTVYDEIKAYDQRVKDYTAMTINTIETIASAIDARDEYTGGHSERVGLYAERLAREMAADYDLTEEDILRVQYIGLIHDIGKIGVADSVLNKTGKLTNEEFSLMKKHTEIGYEIMSSFNEGIDGLLDGIRYHHERFDGKGYPDGLSDTDIPLIARILAIADSYDAMTSNRVYRERLSDEIVRNELIKCSGTQFDPALIEIFVRLLDKKEITPYTFKGIAVDDEGTVRNSALLEKKLQKDLRHNVPVSNPSHVRMLCYVMKLMERKGKDYQVVFVDASQSKKKISDICKNYTDAHDVTLHYTDTQYIIALYDKDKETLEQLIKEMKEKSPGIGVVYLRK